MPRRRPAAPPRPAPSRPAAAPHPARPDRLVRLGLLVLAAAVLAAMAWWRPIDGDEGYYAAAAGLTASGAVPYADYFYPQAPLLPWVYAPVVAVLGPSLRALRGLSALLAFATVLVWAWHLARSRPGRPWLQAAVLALLVAAPGVISWSVTVKTYALTGLLASIALVALARGLEPGARPAWLAGAGLVLGLAGATRLFFVPLGPVLAAGLVLWPGAAGRRGAAIQAAWLLGGFALGSGPLLAAWLRDPAVFAFNNLGYHELRFSVLRDLHPDPTAWVRLGAALAGTGRVLATNPYLLLVLALAAAGAAGLRGAAPAERRLPAATALAAAVFLLGCMAPDPVHDQYFTAPLPLLVLPLAAVGLERLVGADRRRALAAAGVALAFGAVLLGVQRPGMDPDPLWSFRTYDRVVARVRELSRPGDVVLSFWPGYVFGAGRRHFPGMENHFAIGVSEKLTPAERTRYRVAGRGRLAEAFRVQGPRLVVLGAWMNEINTALDDQQMQDLLAVFQAGYEGVALEGAVTICVPLEGP